MPRVPRLHEAVIVVVAEYPDQALDVILQPQHDKPKARPLAATPIPNVHFRCPPNACWLDQIKTWSSTLTPRASRGSASPPSTTPSPQRLHPRPQLDGPP